MSDQLARKTSSPAAPVGNHAWGGWRIPLAVAGVALLFRLWVILRGGGLYALMGYDDGVYYTAAAKLLIGQVPYRDFVLLHPPLITLVLAPFAEFGRLIGDRDAMAVARVAFLVLGALNAGLAARVASVLGRSAALVAGGFMAVWISLAIADRSVQLQPICTLMLLVALLLLYPVQRRRWLRETQAELLAGLALGLGACTKVWAGVPFLVLAVTLLLTRGWRATARLALGAAGAALVVLGPFVLVGGSATIRMIFLDQLGRPGIGSAPLERLPRLIGVLPYLSESTPRVVVIAVTFAAGAILAVLTVVALRTRVARLWVALLIANSLLLLAAPVFFTVYAAFIAVPLALVLGAAAAVVSDRLRVTAPRRVRVGAAAAAVAVLALMGAGTVAAAPVGSSFPGRQLASFVPAQGCVRADSPIGLIQLNILSSSLGRGCDVPADFTGITYDRLARSLPNGSPVPRESNVPWQDYARAYLTGGSATILVRGAANGFDDTTLRTLSALPVLGRADGWTLLRAPGAAAGGTAGRSPAAAAR